MATAVRSSPELRFGPLVVLWSTANSEALLTLLFQAYGLLFRHLAPGYSLRAGMYGRFFLLMASFCTDWSNKVTTYFQHFNDDRLFLRLAVAGLILFTTLKSCQSLCVIEIYKRLGAAFLLHCYSAMLWVEFIDAFGDPNLAFTTLLTHWSVRINSLGVRTSLLWICLLKSV